MTIYTTTELKLIQDNSEDLAETWEFMKRRVEDAQQIGNGFNSLGAMLNISGDVCYSGFHWVCFWALFQHKIDFYRLDFFQLRNVTGLNGTKINSTRKRNENLNKNNKNDKT